MAKTPYEKAIQVASKRLPLKSEKQINKALEDCVGNYGEAYLIGAEETQREIIFRLRALAQKESATR